MIWKVLFESFAMATQLRAKMPYGAEIKFDWFQLSFATIWSKMIQDTRYKKWKIQQYLIWKFLYILCKLKSQYQQLVSNYFSTKYIN